MMTQASSVSGDDVARRARVERRMKAAESTETDADERVESR